MIKLTSKFACALALGATIYMTAFALLGTNTAVAADSSEDVARTTYLQAFSMQARGDAARDERDWEQALVLYTGALELFDRLQQEHAEWRSDVVGQHLRDARQQVAFVTNMIESSESEAEQAPRTDTTEPEATAEPVAVVSSEAEGLQSENIRLARRVEELEGNLAEMEEEHRRSVEDMVEPLRRENQELQTRLSELTVDGSLMTDSQLQQRVIDLTEENLSLNEKASELLGTIRELRGKEVRLARLTQNYERIVSENRALKEKQEQGYDTLIGEQRRIWRERFEELQKAMDSRLSQEKSSREELSAELNVAQQKIQEREAKIEDISSANQELEQRVNELADADRVISRQERDLERLNERLQRLTERYEEEVHKLNEEWSERLVSRNRRIERRIERLTQENEELKREAEENQESWGAERIKIMSEKAEKLAAIEAEKEDLAAQLSELSDSQDRIEQQQEEMERMRAAVHGMTEKHRTEIEALQEEHKKERERFSETTKMWRTRFEELSSSLEEARSQVAAKDQQLEELRELYAETDIAKLQREFASERRGFQRQIEVLRESLLRMRDQRDALSEEKSEQQSRVLELERTLRRLRD